MALVDYPSSEEEEDEKASLTTLKRKRDEAAANDLPPLPSKFHDLYASTTRVSTRDDPSLHGGRKRVTPHVEGNWPSHLYIEWYPAATEYALLSKLISNLKNGFSPEETSTVNSSLTSDLGAPLPLHISLSRPIGFLTEQKDRSIISLEAAIKSSGIRPFDITFSGLDWVANFENTRWFLVLRVAKPESDGLNKLLHVCNSTVQGYGQPPLYTKPLAPSNAGKKAKRRKRASKENIASCEELPKPLWIDLQDVSEAFHISIAWTLGSPSQEILALTESIAKDHLKRFEQTQVNVNEIKAKVGNVVSNMALPTNIQEPKSMFSV